MASSSKPPGAGGGVTHRAYTLQYKLSVVDWIKRHSSSTRAASKRFGLHRKIVRTWLEKEAELHAAVSSVGPQRSRLRVGGRKPLSPELEHRLLSWLENRRRNGATVSDRQLQDKALDIAAEMGLANFKASNMWLSRWKRRGNVVCENGSNTVGAAAEPAASKPSLIGEYPPCILNADSILSYTDRSEKIRLVYVAEEHQEATCSPSPPPSYYCDYGTPEHNYCDYGTPEHNYCTTQSITAVDQSVLLLDPLDSLLQPVFLPPIPCHEEIVGSDQQLLSDEDDSSCCVILRPTLSSCTTKLLQQRKLTDESSTASGVAGRMSQPIFNMGPEIVYVDLP